MTWPEVFNIKISISSKSISISVFQRKPGSRAHPAKPNDQQAGAGKCGAGVDSAMPNLKGVPYAATQAGSAGNSLVGVPFSTDA